jgi:simple sugar transport system ATP-binding protein
LDQISFSVRPGEIFGVAGVDGNGQKQLAEVIAGQLSAASGQIVFDQQDVSARSVAQRQSLGLRYLTDDRLGEGTVGGFSVALNAVLKRVGESPFWQNGWTKQHEIDAYALDLIATYDVRTPGPNAPVGTLSGGNIQKLLFGRELARSPKLVVYNKPTYGLDVANIQAARERIRAQARAGVAAVVISTELEELVELCDRVAVMSRGRLAGVVDACEDYAEAIGGLMVGGVKA